jgi:glucose-1-phosphate cytidylyltransferase
MGNRTMKVAILAGGRGSRMLQATSSRPKPLLQIGGFPILYHIMRYHGFYEHRHFVIALGYKGDLIRKRMADLCAPNSGPTVPISAGRARRAAQTRPAWVVEFAETGLDTATGGRIRRLRSALGDEAFMLTYGDVVSDVKLTELVAYHRSHGKLATLTAVHPPCRFGRLELDGDRVNSFAEKPVCTGEWISGGLFVLEPGVFDYIAGDATRWECEPLEHLARDGQLMAFRHTSFWQCMDTPHDRQALQDLWCSGNAPWKVWE